jgi:hypothetical protein
MIGLDKVEDELEGASDLQDQIGKLGTLNLGLKYIF